jgi:hypothetical protein
MIPLVLRETVLQALSRFGGEMRNSAHRPGWDQRAAQRYAVEVDGKLYPPMEVIRPATERRTFPVGTRSISPSCAMASTSCRCATTFQCL